MPSHNCIIISQCSVFKVHLWISFSRNSMKPRIFFLRFSQSLLWWRVPGSNRWPPACKAGALPAELTPHWDSCMKWWAKMDSNHRPHDYQSCALASWAIGPYLVEIKSTLLAFKQKLKSSTCVFISPLPIKPASLGLYGSPFGLTSFQGTFALYPLNWIT